MGNFKNLTGQIFGKLIVIERTQNKKNRGNAQWLCKCQCGNEIIVDSGHLITGHTKSCGCFRVEYMSKKFKKHGMRNERLYSTWCNMKQRCYDKQSSAYKDYGGRGISICDEWLSDFTNFYNWAIQNGYKENLSIDRIDNNGNYEPPNCRWVTMKEQSRNTRGNRNITYKGETHCLGEWAEILNMNYGTLYKRLNLWDLEKAFTKPVQECGR